MIKSLFRKVAEYVSDKKEKVEAKLSALRQKVAMVMMVLLSFGVAFSNPASAAADYTTLTDAIDYSTASAAILVVAAALATFYIGWKGATYILGAIKRG